MIHSARSPRILLLAYLVLACGLSRTQPRAAEEPLRVLFLGNRGHHRPQEMFAIAEKALRGRGIEWTYTNDVGAFNGENLARYDVVAIFRDGGDLPEASEKALLSFVRGGKGLVAIHCASHCFRNSDAYTRLVGGRFLRHGTGVFRARIVDAQHPAMQGVRSFESWDETYVHDQLSDDRRVLMVRLEGARSEPYTWVRDEGEGRVYYTALGHNERTWTHPGFHRLLEQALLWAAGRVKEEKPPLKRVPAELPLYRPGGRQGRLDTMQLPLKPEDSMRHMHLPEGFECRLFAAEPQVVKPIAMDFDERGRLWVIESVDYPNTLLDDPLHEGKDRIKVLEDTDGDGRADRTHIFADRLNIPTSLVHAEGGVFIALAPYIAFLKDTDGDGTADVRKVVYSGFGRGDTHAVHSNFHYGFDNWFYACVGYSGARVTAGGVTHRVRQGFFRFRPGGSAFEVLTGTNNNTWGLAVDPEGDIFGSTANNYHSWYLAIPNRYFERVRGWHGSGSTWIEDHKKFHPVTDDVRQVDWHGGYTAASGHEFYTARSFPEEYWDRAAFVCEPTGHLIHVHYLDREGSHYVAREGYNILASSDGWTAPIAARTGPDGALWWLDWYNYVVQHNPTPSGFRTGRGNAYVTPLRDKEHGRIYRIVYTGGQTGGGEKRAPSAEPLDLSRATVGELVAALGHENLFWRLKAQQKLVEGKLQEAVPLLAPLVEAGKEPAATHALRTLEGLGAVPAEGPVPGWLRKALLADSARLRRAALAALPRIEESVRLILESGVLEAEDALVRKDALLALAEMPPDAAGGKAVADALAEVRNAKDRWIPLAATSAGATHAEGFLAAAASEKAPGDAKDALRSAIRAVAEHFARGEDVGGVPDLLEKLGAADPALRRALLEGLAAGWREGRPPPGGDAALASLKVLAREMDASGLVALIALARRWGRENAVAELVAPLREALVEKLSDPAASDEERIGAARELLALDTSEAAVGAIAEAIGPQAPPAVVVGFIDALGGTNSPRIGSVLVGAWERLTPDARRRAMGVLLKRAEWSLALLDAVAEGTISPRELTLDQVRLLRNHPDRKVAERAAAVLADAGTAGSSREEILAAFLPVAEKRGDPVRGREVYEKNCARCHHFDGLGERIGPDLSGIAARSRRDVLADILDPNRSVEANYLQYTAVTLDGRVVSGLLLAETRTAVELLDTEAKRHVIQRDQLARLTGSQLSLMPEGFEKLGEEGLADLLEFLFRRTRYVPLSLEKVATAVSTRGMFYSPESRTERLVFPRWGRIEVFGVPFELVDPRGDRRPNVILLHGPQGSIPPRMPRSVKLECRLPTRAIHLLSGVSGWGYPASRPGTVSMIVRLHYADGTVEEHPLRNGEHFADYIRQVDVPGSKLAMLLRGRQIRYLVVRPRRTEPLQAIEFVKGNDPTAPVIAAVTVETPGEE